jgi:curved DNA-binding protein CbpA
MNQHSNSVDTRAPHEVLGLSASASLDDLRCRYLELVKQFPPEREPERFRKIHQAYSACCDPLTQAKRIMDSHPVTRDWNELLEEEAQRPPRLGVEALLSLGNKRK